MEQKTETKQTNDTLSTNGQKITKDMAIGDVVHQYPSLAEVLLSEGVHCVGCGAAYWETIEQGLLGHGKTTEDVDAIIKKLNEAIPEEIGSSETLIITEKAAEKVKELLKNMGKEKTGLRIEVLPGGCSGFQYNFAYEEEKQEGDELITIGDVTFYIDQDSMMMLRGAKVDYVESLQASGFKISNPNAKSTCGCGQSFH